MCKSGGCRRARARRRAASASAARARAVVCRGERAACDAGRDANWCNAMQNLLVWGQGLHAAVCGVVATVTLLLAPPLRRRLDLMRLMCEKHTPDTMKTDATALVARTYQNAICCRNHRSTCAPQCHVIFCCALLFATCCLINKNCRTAVRQESHRTHLFLACFQAYYVLHVLLYLVSLTLQYHNEVLLWQIDKNLYYYANWNNGCTFSTTYLTRQSQCHTNLINLSNSSI